MGNTNSFLFAEALLIRDPSICLELPGGGHVSGGLTDKITSGLRLEFLSESLIGFSTRFQIRACVTVAWELRMKELS